MRILYKLIRIALKTAAAATVLAAVVAISLFLLFKHGLPASAVSGLADRLLRSEEYFLRIDRLSYSFAKGFRLSGVKLFNRKFIADPIFSADDFYIDYSLAPNFAPPLSRIRSITVVAPRFPVLPERAGTEHKKDSLADLEIPDFELTLKEPDILGIQARSLRGTVGFSNRKLVLKNAYIQWIDRAEKGIAGQCEVDLDTRLAEICANGSIHPQRVLPLMEPSRIDSPAVIKLVRRFSDHAGPVRGEMSMQLNIDNLDFAMSLKLGSDACTYNATPLRNFSGILKASQFGKYINVEIDDAFVMSHTGPLSGSLRYEEEKDLLDFKCESKMDAPNFFDIIGLLDDDSLEIIHCSVPPVLKGGGRVFLSSSDHENPANDAKGSLELARGAILNFHVSDTVADVDIRATRATLSNLSAKPEHGGEISGSINFDFPDYDRDKSTFESNLTLKEVDLRDICHAMSITNERPGKLSGNIHLKSSVLKERALKEMRGSGHIDFKDGVIAQIPVFAGLTPFLADKIPGISPLVNQSSGSLDFTITDGMLSFKNIKFEGAMFVITGRGGYDLANDRLELVLRANFFKETGIIGKIAHWITFPFTKLLLEFKVTGSLENPRCSYINILEKIMAL